MLLLSVTSTGHLLSDWLGGKHVLLFAAMNQKEKRLHKLASPGRRKRQQVYKCVDVKTQNICAACMQVGIQ